MPHLNTENNNTILIIEDSKIIHTMLRKTFKLTRYNTVAVKDVREALTLINDNKEGYLAVLLDLMIPGVKGVEIVKQLRKLPTKASKTIVIGLTGSYDQFSPSEFKQLGFNAVVIKPIDCDILVNLLERLCDPEADRWLGVIDASGEVEL